LSGRVGTRQCEGKETGGKGTEEGVMGKKRRDGRGGWEGRGGSRVGIRGRRREWKSHPHGHF